MKLSIKMNRHSIASKALIAATALFVLSSCNKNFPTPPVEAPLTIEVESSHSSEVLTKWMGMQVRLMKNTAGPNHGFARHMAYSGIAAVEALKPGQGIDPRWSSKWNGLTGLPNSETSKKYFRGMALSTPLGVGRWPSRTASPAFLARSPDAAGV